MSTMEHGLHMRVSSKTAEILLRLLFHVLRETDDDPPRARHCMAVTFTVDPLGFRLCASGSGGGACLGGGGVVVRSSVK